MVDGGTSAVSGGTVVSGGTCRTHLVSLDDETYFSNTTRHNDVDGDGFKDGETVGDGRVDAAGGGKGNTGRWGSIDVDQGVGVTYCIPFRLLYTLYYYSYTLFYLCPHLQ